MAVLQVQLEHAPKTQYHWAIAPPANQTGRLIQCTYQRRQEKRVVPQTAIKPRSSRVPVVRGEGSEGIGSAAVACLITLAGCAESG